MAPRSLLENQTAPVPAQAVPLSLPILITSEDSKMLQGTTNHGEEEAVPALVVATPCNDNDKDKHSDCDKHKEEQRLLWLIRILYLSYYASTGSLIPYLAVYYRSLGHEGTVIGFLCSIRSFLGVVFGPLWGLLADSQVHNLDTMTILRIAVFGSVLGYLSIGLATEAPFLALAVTATAIFYAPVKSLLDSMVLSRISNKNEFGKLRMFGPVGYGLGCFLSGVLATQSNTTHGYRILFAFFAIMNVPLLGTLWFFPVQNKQSANKTKTATTTTTTTPNQKNKNSLTKRLLNLPTETWLFFFLVLFMGVNSGAIETFCYVRMKEVGATGQQIGFGRLLSAIAGTPMFWFSATLAKHIRSEQQILALCLLAYVLRFLMYSLARNPYDALPAEAIRGVYFAAFYSTASKYATRNSPEGFQNTMLMIVNCLYGGLGASIGSTLAGFLQNQMGTLRTFQLFMAYDAVFVALLTLYLMIPNKQANAKHAKIL